MAQVRIVNQGDTGAWGSLLMFNLATFNLATFNLAMFNLAMFGRQRTEGGMNAR
jgi:hypothetical protein